MGRPDNLEHFLRLEADDVTVYVSQEILERQKPGTRRIRFYIDGYGAFWLDLDQPWRGIETTWSGKEP
ncbi:MAG: hypothetical protein PVF54_08165 [Anaerolineae bacterium]|jgi:hypothetical protein